MRFKLTGFVSAGSHIAYDALFTIFLPCSCSCMPLRVGSRAWYACRSVVGKSLLREEDDSEAKLLGKSLLREENDVEAIDCQSRSCTRKAMSKRNCRGVAARNADG